LLLRCTALQLDASVVNGSEFDYNSSSFDPWLRITREGSRFQFFTRADDAAPWVLRQALDRSDMGAAPTLEVGVWFAAFTDPAGNGNIGTARFDNFSLTTVPEPGSLAQALVAAAVLIACTLRRPPASSASSSP
jgi:hypothetical protein